MATSDGMTTDTQPLTAWEIALADSLLVDVDLTRDVPCAWLTPCDTPAAWLLVLACCKFTNPHCTQHRAESEKIRAGRTALACRKCGAVNPDHEWVEL